MKKFFLHIKGLISVLCGVVLFFAFYSCSDETAESGRGTGSDKEVNVKFSLGIDFLQTKSIAGMKAKEEELKELTLLIFHNDALHQLNTLPVNSSMTGFTIKTDITEQDVEVTFWLVTNAAESFRGAGLRPGDTKESVRKALTLSFSSSGTENELFPMWGEAILDEGIQAGTSIEIGLIRALARVDVMLDDATQFPADVTEFKLVTAEIFQANNKIQVIPDAITGDNKVTEPSIPASAVADVTTDKIKPAGDSKIYGLYLPESLDANTMFEENATCILLECEYKKNGNPQTAYYRLYFKNDGGYFPVLRNKHYMATIREITGYGTTDPDGATDRDMVAGVMEWEEEEIGGTEDFMSVSGKEIDLFFYKNSTGIITIKSDLNLYDLRFCDQSGDPLITSPVGELIESERFRVEIEDDGKTIRASALQNNETDDVYTEYVLVTSGNIRFMVTINQGTRKMRDYINVFNITGLMGNLGDEVYNIHADFDNPLSTYGRGLRMILKNQDNFGWNGIVPFEGFIISGLPFQTALSPELLDLFQVIFMPVVASSASAEQEAVTGDEARNVINWLRAKDDRVLVVISALNSNTVLLEELGIKVNTYAPNFYSTYSFPSRAPDAIINGPFGKLEGNLAVAGPGVQSYINAKDYPDILPILVNNNDENHIVLGVNVKERIVFCSSYWLHTLTGSAGVLTNNGIITNSYDRVIANLWAWIAETVLKDEHDPDVTY